MIRTPEELKKALGCCDKLEKIEDHNSCAYLAFENHCVDKMIHDALEYIEHLETERRALVKRYSDEGICQMCRHADEHQADCELADYDCSKCKAENCMCGKCITAGWYTGYEWNGGIESENA